jgi:hypothetical protein
VCEWGAAHGEVGGAVDLCGPVQAAGAERVGGAGDLDPGDAAVAAEEQLAGERELGVVQRGGWQVEAAGVGVAGLAVDLPKVVGGGVQAAGEFAGGGGEPVDAGGQ